MTTTKTGSDDVRSTIHKIVHDVLNVDAEKITDDAKLIDDLSADSFDTIELTIAVEDEFEIDITDAEVEGLKTVGDVIELVSKKTAVPA